jgi:NAD(P)-dependent dehydrogenase (short-subunit alcohol dehydrogenase family)
LGLLEGKTALITGVDSNIGIATAKEFVNEGADVLITARSNSALTAALTVIGKNVIGLKVDVSNPADLNILVAQIIRDMGKLDILFANADVAEFFLSANTTDEPYYSKFQSLVFTIQKALSVLRNGASIIIIAPAVTKTGITDQWFLSATIEAIRAFARALPLDLTDRFIRVNALSLGAIDPSRPNDLQVVGAAEQHLGILSKDIETSKPSTTAEIAEAIVSLCDGSREITGNELIMDGGEAHFKPLSGTLALDKFGTPEEVAKNAVFLASDISSSLTGMELFVDDRMAKL